MTICAWCEKLLKPAPADPPRGSHPVSHGICTTCMSAQLTRTR